MVDIGIHVHDFVVNRWKSTNENIEEILDEFREEKEVLVASNKELMDYIRTTLGSTLSSYFI